MPKTSHQNAVEEIAQTGDENKIADSIIATDSDDNINSSSRNLSGLESESFTISSNSKETDKLKQYDDANKVEIKKTQEKILLSIECVILEFLIENIILILCSVSFKFIIFDRDDGLLVASIIISISSFTFNLLLIISAKIGFSNHPNSTKLFRVSIIIIFLLLIANFTFQMLICVIDYLNNQNITKDRFFLYSLSCICFMFFIPILIQGLKLSFESFLILINVQKEYKNLFSERKKRLLIYNRFYQNQFGSKNRSSQLANVVKFTPGKEMSQNTNPAFSRFHNSVNQYRKDDEYYRKMS